MSSNAMPSMLWGEVEHARKRVRKFHVAERGIVVGRKVGGRRGLPTASNANVKTGE